MNKGAVKNITRDSNAKPHRTDNIRQSCQINRFMPGVRSSNAAMIHGLVFCIHLVILILLYGQSYYFDYVYFDDAEYVLENPAVRSGLTLDGFKWAFTSIYMSNWHPLAWLSHMLDVSLFGVDPGWAHVHNFLLHGVNSLLVYVILLKLCGNYWKACVLSLVFLVHPLHVESVAWIAERKDLLCAFFFLLGLLLYDDYRERTSGLRYVGVLLSFSLALMAKPMAVTFPVVLLILDFFVYREHFPSGNDTGSNGKIFYYKAVVEKIPLLALSAMTGAITIAAQDANNALAYLEAHSISSRWKTATSAYITYLWQFLFPVDLAAFYPLSKSTSFIDFLLPGFILIILICIATVFASAFPLIAAGLCWYLVTLLPVIGLIQVGSQAHADRYMYLPSIGVLLSCLYLIPSIERKNFQFVSVLSILIILYLSMLSYWQIGYWKNQNVLFSRVLEVAGPNYLAHSHLAKDYMQRGMLAEAEHHSLAAIDLEPGRPEGYHGAGDIALALEKYQTAEKFYRLALSKGSKSAVVLSNLGVALVAQGKSSAGMQAFEMALRVEPKLVEARENLKIHRALLAQEINQ